MKSRITKLWLLLLTSISFFSVSAQTTHLVISQLFGSGGISASLPNNDFIELYNPTNSTVNLSGWSVQFAFGSATTYTKISLSGNITPKGYYLIQLDRDNYATGTPMPTPDLVYNYNINSPDMKIGLFNFNTDVTGDNPAASAVDFVGTGVATGYETSAAPQGSYSVSLLRKSTSASTAATMAVNGSEFNNGNGYDTGNNAEDLLLTTSVTARSSNRTPLPVHMIVFTVTKTAAGNLLRWQVDAPADVDHFEVEKSTDAKSFTRIGQVQTNTAYEFTDGNTGSIAYYRIKIPLKDGLVNHSAVVLATGSATAAGSLNVYPSLATESVTLQFAESKPGDQLLIYNMDGNVQQRLQPGAKQTQTTLQVSSLKPGTYVVHYLTASGGATTTRFIKAG